MKRDNNVSLKPTLRRTPKVYENLVVYGRTCASQRRVASIIESVFNAVSAPTGHTLCMATDLVGPMQRRFQENAAKTQKRNGLRWASPSARRGTITHFDIRCFSTGRMFTGSTSSGTCDHRRRAASLHGQLDSLRPEHARRIPRGKTGRSLSCGPRIAPVAGF